MDYEALEKARSAYGTGAYDDATLEFLFPQLKESEDERIRKGIIEIIKAVSGPDCDVYLDEKKQEKYLSWLEKQKEQKPISSCDIVPYIDDKIVALQDMWREEKVAFDWDDMHEMIEDVARHFYQKEQKPAEWNANDKAFIKDCANILVANDYAASAERLLSMFPVRPAEWSDTNELVFKDICKHLKEEGYNGWIVLLNALRNGEFQPKPEWSEKDERMMNRLIDRLNFIQYNTRTDGTSLNISFVNEIEWLKSLPERFNLQPKQEWSEEDIQHRNSILLDLHNMQSKYKIDKRKNWKDADFYDCCMKDNGENIEWLESLPERFNFQPKQEWSEEDEKILERFLGWLQGTMGEKTYSSWLKSLRERFNLQPNPAWSEEDSKRYISIGTTLETSAVLSKEDYDANMVWLRDLVNAKKYSVPKPSWKPSEEHLSALLAIFNDPDNIGSQTCQLALTDLYEQLKKL